MKRKHLCLLLVLFIMMFCSACNNEGENSVMYRSGVYSNKNWSDSIGTYKKDVIPDEDTAIKIAEAIFNGMEKSKTAEEYTPQSVYYDVQDEIWIVTFFKKSDKITVGNDCSIAMQKKDGKVLRIWFGE